MFYFVHNFLVNNFYNKCLTIVLNFRLLKKVQKPYIEGTILVTTYFYISSANGKSKYTKRGNTNLKLWKVPGTTRQLSSGMSYTPWQIKFEQKVFFPRVTLYIDFNLAF